MSTQQQDSRITPIRGSDYFLIGAESDGYRSVVSEYGSGHQAFSTARARGKGTLEGALLRANLEAEAGITINSPAGRYLDVREAYLQTPSRLASLDAAVGRKLEDWSRLDSYWQLGLWQPRFRWNYFDPEVVGLTGLFFSKSQPGWRVALFASPFYIPEQGAQFSVSNGVFSTSHPFFAAPPAAIPLFGKDTPVAYALDVPSTASVVSHAGAGAMAGLGTGLASGDGPWVKAAYAYQPVNQLLLGYNAYLALSPKGQQVNASLHPRVLYHHIGSMESGYHTGRWSAWVAGLVDHLVKDSPPANWTLQETSPMVLASATLEGHWDRFTGGVSYLHSWGGFLPDSGSLAQGSGSLFESRVQYRDATSLRVAASLYESGDRRLSASSRAIYDSSVQGVFLSPELRYGIGPRWRLTLGGDVVAAVLEQAPGQGGADFFYLYRTYDRVRGSIAYAF